jgi:hypothetical protein
MRADTIAIRKGGRLAQCSDPGTQCRSFRFVAGSQLKDAIFRHQAAPLLEVALV